MRDVHCTSTIPSSIPSSSNEHEVELSYVGTSTDNYSIGSNTSSSHGKYNSITRCFQKIVKKMDCLNIEKRGIERISPEDRTDSKIINTAMIWVRNLLLYSMSHRLSALKFFFSSNYVTC